MPKTSSKVDFVIVERGGTLKASTYNVEKGTDELYKKCGFKKPDGFGKQTDWVVRVDDQRIIVTLYAKMDGKANTENKYDFPPPVDTKLFFGNCALIASRRATNADPAVPVALTPLTWQKCYDFLFGGFEDIRDENDETEGGSESEADEDELDFVPKSRKTKNGYLKDGFVVDDDADEEEEYEEPRGGDDDDEDFYEKPKKRRGRGATRPPVESESEDELQLHAVGSELTEEAYDYDD